MRRVIVVGVLLALTAAPQATTVAAAAPAWSQEAPRPTANQTAADLGWASRVLTGGVILHFRHAKRNTGFNIETFDRMELSPDAGVPLEEIADKVCLNEAGRTQAAEMAHDLRRLKVPVMRVVSSPLCRARETSSLAFGRLDEMSSMLLYRGVAADTDAALLRDYLNGLPASFEQSNTNLVLVGHASTWDRGRVVPIAPGVSLSVPEGGFVVLHRDASGAQVRHVFAFEAFVGAADQLISASRLTVGTWLPKPDVRVTKKKKRATAQALQRANSVARTLRSASMSMSARATEPDVTAVIAQASVDLHRLSLRAQALSGALAQGPVGAHKIRRVDREVSSLLRQHAQVIESTRP